VGLFKMKIVGLQKVSTIDYPGNICCVIFLRGCNFRCGFCYNFDIVVKGGSGAFSEEYILNFLKKRVGKLDGVCISGGEPLMSLDFDFVRKIKDLGFKVKVDTNGSFPEQLKEMIDLGLVDYIAMDVKSCKNDYSRVAGVGVDLDAIERSMKMIYDFGNYEFRTTVVGRLHSKESVIGMAKWIYEVCGGRPKKFFLQGFKNKGEMIDSSFNEEKDVGEDFLEELKKLVGEYFEEVGVRV
jgi:pyruvate formate lyase activating enzyme